jgi:TonB family protein
MKQGLLTIALLSAFPGPSLAAPLQPTGKWVLDFADQRCLATRNYGSADQPLYLALKPSPAGGLMQLIIARKAAGSTYADQGKIVLRPASQDHVSTTYLAWTDRSSKLRLVSVILTSAQFNQIRNATGLAVEADKELRREFALTAMPALAEQVGVCLTGLQQYWNIRPDGAPGEEQRPAPIANLAKLFSSDDYPGHAIRNEQKGQVKFIVLVDEAGKQQDCTVTEASGIASLDAQTCAVIMERATFRPATVGGKAIKSWMEGRIRWELPGR